MVFAELELFWREARGPEAQRRVWALVDAGVRLEVELGAMSDDGALIMTRERMCGGDVPASLAPLRSTGVYLVDRDQILSITRVVDADQRNALVAEALVGGYWVVPGPRMVFRFTADGSYRMAYRRDELDYAPLDRAVVAIEAAVATSMSDEAAQVCRPGDVGLSHVRFTGADHVTFNTIDDMCASRGARPTWELVRLRD